MGSHQGFRAFQTTGPLTCIGALYQLMATGALAYVQRRRWERVQCVGTCPYETTEALGNDSLVIHRGTAISINYSAGGMLLLIDQAPRPHQILALRLSGSATPSPNHTLVEVRWTRAITVETEEAANQMYLAGVRFLFSPPARPFRAFPRPA